MRLVCLLFILLFSEACFSQASEIQFTKVENQYYIDSTLINSLNYEIINNGEKPYWIWFDKNKINDNNFVNIRNFFKKVSNGADGSLYQWMCDMDVSSFIGSIFSSWMKVLSPKGKFYISFLYDSEEIRSMTTLIDASIVFAPEVEVIKQCPGINDERIKEKFTYQPIFINIPWNLFYNGITCEADSIR